MNQPRAAATQVEARIRVGAAVTSVAAELDVNGSGHSRATVQVPMDLLASHWRPGEDVRCEVEGAYEVRPILRLVAGAHMATSVPLSPLDRFVPIVFAIEPVAAGTGGKPGVVPDFDEQVPEKAAHQGIRRPADASETFR